MKHLHMGFSEFGVSGWRAPVLDDFDSYEENDFLAQGTGVGELLHIFEVTIRYEVPIHLVDTLSDVCGESPKERTWALEVSASSPEEAKRCATRDFRLLESLTSDVTQRHIVEILVIDN